MNILEKHAPFVKEQISFQDRMADKYAEQPWRRDLHLSNVSRLLALLEDLETIQDELNIAQLELANLKASVSLAEPTQRSMMLTPDDLEGLPEELLQELNISDADKQEFAIVSIINEAGGVLSLDKIIVGIYRKTKEIVKRSALISRLFRMAQKELIFSVPQKKGFYATRPMTEQDVRRIFGAGGVEDDDGDQGSR